VREHEAAPEARVETDVRLRDDAPEHVPQPRDATHLPVPRTTAVAVILKGPDTGQEALAEWVHCASKCLRSAVVKSVGRAASIVSSIS
jgi:hypothetical protein